MGQGDAIYMRTPEGVDMLIDGGPNRKVLDCLGRHMPFYDRTIDLVFLTHPQKDHFQGLISVLNRYQVKYFVTVPIINDTDSFKELVEVISKKGVPVKSLFTGDEIHSGKVIIHIVWPQRIWLENQLEAPFSDAAPFVKTKTGNSVDLNTYSLYLHIQLGEFDMLLTGDGDILTQKLIGERTLMDFVPSEIEVLKVPHHGSRTGILPEFVEHLQPHVSVIEVGKNSYGHPNHEVIKLLSRWGTVLRTDLNGDIEVTTDGSSYQVKPDSLKSGNKQRR